MNNREEKSKKEKSKGINHMDEYKDCVIYYPRTYHPLFAKEEEVKRSYIAMIEKFAGKYGGSSKIAREKLRILYEALFGMEKGDNGWKQYKKQRKQQGDNGKEQLNILKINVFLEGYLLLFDCLLLFAVEDEQKGNDIKDKYKSMVRKSYQKFDITLKDEFYNSVDEMVWKMYQGDCNFAERKMISDQLVTAWRDGRNFVLSDHREILFTATMSAGKSTLINAIMGGELSRTKKAACTSSVIKFCGVPAKSDLYTVMEGRKYSYRKDVNYVKNYLLRSEDTYCIWGYFSSLLSREKVTLVDTPGIDSSLNVQHKEITRNERNKEEANAIVYVIPVEHCGAEADDKYLRYIREKFPSFRVIFVVNMLDECDMEDDSIPGILSNIRIYLEKVGYQEPVICPVSANAGLQLKKRLLGRMALHEKESSENFVRKFIKEEYALGKYYATISDKEKAAMYDRFCMVWDQRVWSAYVNTGLPGFEKLLCSLE